VSGLLCGLPLDQVGAILVLVAVLVAILACDRAVEGD